MNNTRIQLTDNMLDACKKMSEGNFGAMMVLTELAEAKMAGKKGIGMMHWLTLDSYNIYGNQIWMLYKDCCGEDLQKLLLTLRLFQLGAFTREQINNNLSKVTASPFIDETIELGEDVYNFEDNDIKDHHRFEEYVAAQREAFKKKEAENA